MVQPWAQCGAIAGSYPSIVQTYSMDDQEQLPGPSSRTGVNLRFNSDQRQVLQEYWARGMTSCSRDHSALLDECLRKACCAVEQVKVCVFIIKLMLAAKRDMS